MINRLSIASHVALACAFLLTCSTPALAQPSTPTTFTYQGSLSSSGSPLTGQADLRAQLFDAPADGSPIGNAVDLPNTTVTNGLFTAPLDFGNAFDTGQPRWIEFSVRSPAGSGTFTTLAPRQPITPAPLAQGLAGISLSRSGAETLDQAQDGLPNAARLLPTNSACWQSWTPAVNGELTRLQIDAVSGLGIPADVTITVYFGRGLSGPVLGTVTFPVPLPASGSSVQDIPIPSISVRAGYVYTLAFSGNIIMSSVPNPIPGAAGFVGSSPINWWFRTYVTPSAFINAAATSALFATTATTASTAPWSGLTGQAAVTTPAISSGWQFLLHNTSISNFRGGMRLSDAGFLELTNSANILNPSFARLNSAGAWTAVSDARLKTNITTADNTLAAALKLRPVHFRWKDSRTEDFGLIAQEVRQVLPTLVSGDESKDTLTLNYSQLSVVAIGAIQEQQRLIQAQQREILQLKASASQRESEFNDLKDRLSRLERALHAQTAQR